MSWWIPNQRPHSLDTVRWFCSTCERITPIERNPEWDKTFKGEGIAPKWFVRCLVCKHKHLQTIGSDCSNCGYGGCDLEAGTLISATKPEYSYAAAMEFGGTPENWQETHKCPKCRTIFTFGNSNY